ncbi:MAG: hypothetical protein ACXWZG_05010 [Microbacterium sp.]
MEGRTRLALGGMATATASIAVVCAVAMTTSVALADAAGAPVGAPAVVVPAAVASPTPLASDSPTATQAPQAPAPHTVEAETVPAPEPEDVAAAPAPAPNTSASEPAPNTSASEPSPAVEDQLVADVMVSGSWDAARAWAEERGWSSDRIATWIARLESKVPVNRGADSSHKEKLTDPTMGNRVAPLLPAQADHTSGRDQSGSTSGSKRERSRVPPD